jgi:hypothetical protein
MVTDLRHGSSGRGPAPGLRWVRHPYVYEIDTWPWLEQQSRAAGRPVDLASVPDAAWDAIAADGFDAVWLMGVWERSPAGIEIALRNPGLRADFDRALPGWTAADVAGSPYCIRSYTVDPHLGGQRALESARAALAARGMRLLLDFVPNHVAPDHPWTTDHPDRFVTGTSDDLRADPNAFLAVGDHVLANGKDPYFPAWPDVVQLDAFSTGLRDAVIATLLDIADQCDGVRCDMAMLMMNDVFTRTWGSRVGAAPAADYWPTVIGAVRAQRPDFLFLAEAYWDLEWALQQQGFDYCYDKRLYDRLVNETGESVYEHLGADLEYQARLVRFVENHDEPRAAATFDPARERAALVTTLTQTGARLVHDGQLEGRRVRLPVFLGRFPDEPVDAGIAAFHHTLLDALHDETFRDGEWSRCERSGWPNDNRYESLATWSWSGATRWLIVVNLSAATATGLVRAPWNDLYGQMVTLVDPTHATEFDRAGDDLVNGLYVELPPWEWHLFRVEPQPRTNRNAEANAT